MPNRFCPNCNSKLGSYDFYFCSSCSQKLDIKDVTSPEIIQKITTVPIIPIPPKAVTKMSLDLKKLNIKKVLIAIGILLIVIVIVVASVYGKNVLNAFLDKPVLKGSGVIVPTKESSVETKVEQPKEVVTSKKPVCLIEELQKCNVFGFSALAEYVPYGADLYVEGFDFQKFSELFTNLFEKNKSLIDFVAAEKFKPFAFFVSKTATATTWGLLIIPEDIQKSSISTTSKDFFVKKFDSVILISNNKDVLTQSAAYKSKIERSLALNSKYSLLSDKTNVEGTTLLISMTATGKSILEDLNKKVGDISSTFVKDLLTSYFSGKQDYLVL